MWWTFLVAAIAPLAKRALIAVGFGSLTYVGLDSAFEAAKAAVISSYGAMSGDVLAIVSMAGVGNSIGIILGAIAGRLALVTLTSLAKIL